MQVRSAEFKPAARQKLGDQQLYRALKGLRVRMVGGRAVAIQELDNFEEIREAAANVRDFTLAYLDHFLELFERNALARGAHVHWAETGQDVNRIVLEIARANAVRKIIKSKSMLGEESGLNHFLEAGGIEVRETDLGEYIIQEANEHLDAAALLVRAREREPDIDRATVYRTIDLLKKYRLVDELDLMHLQGEKHFYEVKTRRDHAHLACFHCGHIEEFTSDLFEELKREIARQSGFEVRVTRLELGGLCRMCRVPFQNPS